MGLVSGITVYLVIWWLVVFMVLPWGGNQSVSDDDVARGHASGAPVNPRLLLKIGVTTVASAFLWLGVYWIIESGLISFRPRA